MSPTPDTRIDVRKTYKLYVGGAFPRSESGRTYVVHDSKGRFLANAVARLPQGRPRRGAGRPQGVRRLVDADAVQPGSGRLPDRRGPRGPPRAVRRRGAALRGRSPSGRPRPSWTPRSTGWSGTPAGPTRSRRSSAAPTRSPAPYFNFSLPEPTGVVARRSRRRSPRCSGLVSVVAPVIVTGNTVVVATSARAAAAGDHARRRCWPPPTCPAASSTCSPARWPTPRPTLASHMDVNALDLTGLAGDPEHGARRSRSPRPRTSSGSCRAPAAEPDWTAEPGLDRMTAVPRDQDGLAPDRHLRRARPGDRGGRPVRLGQVAACSRLRTHSGVPVVNLDDFYKDGDDPTLPADHLGANAGTSSTGTTPASWSLRGRARRPASGCAATGRPRSRSTTSPATAVSAPGA